MSAPAQVIAQAFHQSHAHLRPEGTLDERQVAMHDLFFERSRGRADDDLASARQRWDQVRKRFSSPCAGLTEENVVLRQRPFDRVRHEELPFAGLVPREHAGKRSR
jgi:hypothetical protein